MFDHIRNLISDCEAVESIKENRYSPENGIIYLRLNTDDNTVGMPMVVPDCCTLYHDVYGVGVHSTT